MYSLLASAINHPDQINQLWALFNHRSLDSLNRRGVDVEAVVPRPNAPPVGPYSRYRTIPARDTSFNYPVSHPRFVYYVPKSLLYHRTGDSVAATVESWYATRTDSHDVFHGCHLFPDGYALCNLETAEDIPVTSYAHGTIINEYGEFRAPVRRRIETTLEEVDHIFCSGMDIQSKIRDIRPDAETSVVPIGATPENFPTERRDSLRRELKIPADAVVVLFCGHLTQNKGVQDIIDILPEIDNESLYFVFIGHGGELKEELRVTLGDSDTQPGKLLWKLHPIAVRRWFTVADLLLLPSYSEGRPTVIYEAMASQTPVLATEVGGIPEQVEDGQTGWLFEPGDKAQLRAKLESLPGEKLHRMGVASEQRLVENGWTWDSHAKRIEIKHTELIGPVFNRGTSESSVPES